MPPPPPLPSHKGQHPPGFPPNLMFNSGAYVVGTGGTIHTTFNSAPSVTATAATVASNVDSNAKEGESIIERALRLNLSKRLARQEAEKAQEAIKQAAQAEKARLEAEKAAVTTAARPVQNDPGNGPVPREQEDEEAKKRAKNKRINGVAGLLWPTNEHWKSFLLETGRAKHALHYTTQGVAAWLLQNEGYCSLLNTVLKKPGVTPEELTDERWWDNVRARAVNLYVTKEKKTLDRFRADQGKRQRAKGANKPLPNPRDSPETAARKMAEFQTKRAQELGIHGKNPNNQEGATSREENDRLLQHMGGHNSRRDYHKHPQGHPPGFGYRRGASNKTPPRRRDTPPPGPLQHLSHRDRVTYPPPYKGI